LLLLTDSYYPGWEATLDGNPLPVLMVDILFRGVIVPAGSHQINFGFASAPYQLGKWVSLLGMVLWLGLVCCGLTGQQG